MGRNKEVAFAKGSRSGPRTVISVAMTMNIKSVDHQYYLSRTWEKNGQARAVTSLVRDVYS